MSTTELNTATATQVPETTPLDMKLEVVILPVSDAERAKQFYASLGWREDADFVFSEDFRVLQFTPPGSQASIIFGTGVTPAVPGSGGSLLLAVDDIEAARAELIERGVDVSEVFHGVAFDATGQRREPGPDPERKSYSSYASFSDPDGNEWLLQEVTSRLPGRVDEPDVATLGEPPARDGPRPPRIRDGRRAARLVGLVRPLPERARAGQHARSRPPRPPTRTWRRCAVWWFPDEVERLDALAERVSRRFQRP